ncbi:HAD-IIIA family hydrolase [Acaryochloris marina]|uniref:HAD-IIIA family hydrolase n=1 Tax=Acaryochloris marina TaxID=155978 RepID=UPI0021C2D9AD|nr:HAD-IIIA family hydrolase [Acaryochloris marina]BDM83225.1 hypothetical protein AM10699_60860 [Acaryochloris marina MBIC10699]
MKLIILDKDGTLTTPKSGKNFVQKPEDQILLPGVLDAVRWHTLQGHMLIIVSNQGGVSAGYKTIAEVILEMKYCLHLLRGIQSAYFCPDFEGNQCWHVERQSSSQVEVLRFRGRMRKPGDGMIQQALLDHPCVSEILFIGDRPEDEQAAQAAGVDFQDAESWRQPRE